MASDRKTTLREALEGWVPPFLAKMQQRVDFPYKGWNDVVGEGYIPTEQRRVRRGQA